MMSGQVLCVITVFALMISEAHAQSGADLLMRSVQKAPSSSSAVATPVAVVAEFKTDDPYLIGFLSEWRGGPALPFHVNQWAQKILTHDFRGAAHLWTQVRKSVPESWVLQARTAYAYTLYRQGLHRAFWQEWMALLARPGASTSLSLTALHQTLQTELPQWLLANGVYADPEHQQTIMSLPDTNSPVTRTLMAWVLLRSARTQLEKTIAVLEGLPSEHALKIPLAKTVVLQFARSGDLARAAQFMKEQMEPAILASKQPKEHSSYYLQLARLLFQAGNLDAAETLYLKIPRGAPEYALAHEELSWVWLRKGDLSRLRGEIASFDTGVLDQKFLPELQMVSAVSNLKLCFYDRVEKNFAEFLRSNGQWATRIRDALAATETPRPREPDFFTELAERGLERREDELRRLEALAQESMGAALPAVGIQSHWVEAIEDQKAARAAVQKRRNSEYRRQWRGMETALREAITKMKFVKVELITQVTQLAQQTGAKEGLDADQVRVSQSSFVKAANGDQVFKFDGVVWPDELFQLQAATQGRCLQ